MSSKIQDQWSDEYRRWLASQHGITNESTANAHVACARTYLSYLQDTERLDFRDWLIKHKRQPRTAATAMAPVRRFREYLDHLEGPAK